MAIKEATDQTFEELVLKNDKPVVVDFWAVWCGPCKLVAPEMEKIAEKYDGKIDVVKVDVDANPGLSQAYQVMSIPTIAFFKPGDQPVGPPAKHKIATDTIIEEMDAAGYALVVDDRELLPYQDITIFRVSSP